MDWSAWRDEFPTFRTTTYLNTCSLAPLAARVRAAQERFLDEWEALGASAWYELWVDALDSLRGKVALVLGARREEIALAPSVSVALSAVASALDYSARPRIVLSDLEFPTLSYQWAVKPAVERVFVPSKDGVLVSPDLFESAADDRTALVATSHVYYTSGAVQDIRAIAKVAHGHGALALIDAYQATGQLPTDVHAADVDVLVTGGLKWLLGGTGIAFLYVRGSLAGTLRPTIAGWFGNDRMFDFDPKVFEFHEGARRFELGTTANAAVYAANAGLDIVLEIGARDGRRRASFRRGVSPQDARLTGRAGGNRGDPDGGPAEGGAGPGLAEVRRGLSPRSAPGVAVLLQQRRRQRALRAGAAGRCAASQVRK